MPSGMVGVGRVRTPRSTLFLTRKIHCQPRQRNGGRVGSRVYRVKLMLCDAWQRTGTRFNFIRTNSGTDAINR